MAKSVIQANVYGSDLKVEPGATVTVYDAVSGALRPLWQDRDGTVTQTNPFSADANGYFRVYASKGRVRLKASSNGAEQIFDDIMLGTAQTLDVEDVFPNRYLEFTSGTTDYSFSNIDITLFFGRSLIPGDTLFTWHYDDNLITGSGAELEHTGSTDANKAGNAPDADGYFYDGAGNQFRIVGPTATFEQFGGDKAAALTWADTLDQFILAHEDVTINVPTDSPDLQTPHDHIQALPGVSVVVNMEAGFQPESVVAVENGDWSMFSITSDDATVTVGAAFSGRILDVTNANAPVVDAFFDANNLASAGFWYNDNSTGVLRNGAGADNVEGRGIYVNQGSRVFGDGAIITNALSRAIWVSRNGVFHGEGVDISGCRTGGAGDTGESALYSSRNGVIHAFNLTANNITSRRIVYCKRTGFINAHESTMSGGSEISVDVNRGGSVAINGSTITDVPSTGMVAAGPGSSIDATNVDMTASAGNNGSAFEVSGGGIIEFSGTASDFANSGVNALNNGVFAGNLCTITGSGGQGVLCREARVSLVDAEVSGSGNEDLAVSRGGQIFANSTTTTNGAGSPDIGDTNVGSFNAIDGNSGIIWN